MAVDPKPFLRILHSDSGVNTLITLKVTDGGDARVLVKKYQLDPVTQHPAPRRLLPRERWTASSTVTVPVVLRGEPRGVKQQGGILDFVHREIEIECLPADIPKPSRSTSPSWCIGDAVHVRDVAANAAWTPVSDPDMMLRPRRHRRRWWRK